MATWASERYSSAYPNTMEESRITFNDGCYMNEICAYVDESVTCDYPVQIYSPSGFRLDQATKDINIIRQSDGRVVKVMNR